MLLCRTLLALSPFHNWVTSSRAVHPVMHGPSIVREVPCMHDRGLSNSRVSRQTASLKWGSKWLACRAIALSKTPYSSERSHAGSDLRDMERGKFGSTVPLFIQPYSPILSNGSGPYASSSLRSLKF